MATPIKVVGSQDGASAFRALVATDLPIATSAVIGAVKPDGTIITVSGAGVTTVPKASDTVFGVVEVDNTTLLSTAGVLSAPAQPLAATSGAPSTTPAAGTVAYDAAANKFYVYNGTAWKGVVLT